MKKHHYTHKRLRLETSIVGMLTPNYTRLDRSLMGTIRTTIGSFLADCTSRPTTGHVAIIERNDSGLER